MAPDRSGSMKNPEYTSHVIMIGIAPEGVLMKLSIAVLCWSVLLFSYHPAFPQKLNAAEGSEPVEGVPPEYLQNKLIRLSDELAVAISKRDADGATRGIIEDEQVVYVSDGKIIRGKDYRDVLRRFYADMPEVHFRWDSREVKPLASFGGIVIDVATVITVDRFGADSFDKAVFTLVYKNLGEAWELVLAHKTTLR